jgi:L-arabinose transport system ATP-binding protein
MSVFIQTSESPAGPAKHPTLFELRGITKSFTNVQALNGITLSVRRGEVLAVIGENGAGKSTLLRILNGDYKPDSGELVYEGTPVSFKSPRDAHRIGVRVIYQEPELVPGTTVAENIYVGELPRRFGLFVDWPLLNGNALAQLTAFGYESYISPHTLGEQLSPAQRQLIEILRALKSGVNLLALDEPTSTLTDEETSKLFATVERLRDQGVGIIYVSHRIREILRLADRVAVLRDGALVAVRPAHETNEAELVRLMVGRPLSAVFDHQSHAQPEVVFRVEGLTNRHLHDVSFEVHRGEVVGLAGLVGAGRTELAKALFGSDRITSGHISVEGRRIRPRAPRDAIAAGIGFAPEDRKAEALLLIRSVRENISLCILDRLRRWRFISRSRERAEVTELAAALQVKTPSIEQEVGTLSGGNQQKVVLARWLARRPKVLILDEPTRGIDVGAKAEIYRLIEQLAADGIAVLFISSELPEILGVSDRILVIRSGRIVGILPARGATEEAILRLAMTDPAAADRLREPGSNLN